MRITIVLALALVLGGVAIAAAPAATACTSDPAIVCGVIHQLDETQECWTYAKYTDPVGTVKHCL